jgi:bacterioferritin-associated ferredoxin
MYVCICNAVREREVRQAIEQGGAATPAEIYARLGVTPACGRCADTICDLLDQAEPVAA